MVGVSAGVFGGARAIQNLVPVLRELGLVTIFWDVNFTTVRRRFDEEREPRRRLVPRDRQVPRRAPVDGRDPALRPRERDDRRSELTRPTMTCPKCGTPMNHQADEARPARHAEEARPDAGVRRRARARVRVSRLRLDRLAPRRRTSPPRRRRRRMRVLDPRLFRRARAARALLVVDAVLGVVMALLVLAQAVLLARVAARSFEGASLDEVATPLVLLVAVVVARALARVGLRGRRPARGRRRDLPAPARRRRDEAAPPAGRARRRPRARRSRPPPSRASTRSRRRSRATCRRSSWQSSCPSRSSRSSRRSTSSRRA